MHAAVHTIHAAVHAIHAAVHAMHAAVHTMHATVHALGFATLAQAPALHTITPLAASHCCQFVAT